MTQPSSETGPMLAQTAGPRRLSTRDQIQEAGIRMAWQARRELLLLSRNLEPDLYDQPGFLDAVRRLAVARPRLPIRILLFEPRTPVMGGHRLIELARQLTSRIAIRSVGDDLQDQFEGLLIVDDCGYILRRNAAGAGAIADYNHPAEARRLRTDFDHIWDHSHADTELRRLHL